MARTVRDAKLETREARNRLTPRPKPHWRTLRPGQLHMGYCRRRKGAPGYWTVRSYLGVVAVPRGKSPYKIEMLPGVADDFEDANGTTVLSYAQAQDKALARHHAGQGTRTGPLTVAETMDDYIKFLRLERKTAADAEVRIRALILPQLGETKVVDLTTDQLVRWRDSLAERPARLRTGKAARKRNVSAPATTPEAKRARLATVNRTLTILKAALNRAFKHGLVDDDLAWRRVTPFTNVQATRPGHLTVAVAKRLINAADAEGGFRDLVQAALITGCRYGELCALRVCDFHRGKIAIHQSKSGKSRDVVLNDEGVKFFEQVTAGRAGDELMFRKEGEPWRKSDQARPMREACTHAKITPPIGFHQLRHTWASLAVMNGVPLLVVARNLGHRDTRMVERHYGHLTESYVDDAIRAGAPRFGKLRPSNVVSLQGSRR
jgi:integrase